MEAKEKGITLHFGTIEARCFLKNAELEARLQKYKGRVVLRGDNIKDKTGDPGVFGEAGCSASLMGSFKAVDFVARLPGHDGHP